MTLAAALLLAIFLAGCTLGFWWRGRREAAGGLDVNTTERKQMWIRERR